MAFDWGTFERMPDEDWVSQPVDSFGLHYDTVENHGWYSNLDLTVEQLDGDLRDGDVLVDYSGGTGILLERLRERIGDRSVGMVIVDSSPKFLRIAVDRFRDDDRVAFRRLRYLKELGRLEFLDEVLPAGFMADGLVSTNAIHLYDDLEDTLAAWARQGARRNARPGASIVDVNGQPGVLLLDGDGALVGVMALDIADGAIQGVRSIVNPEKLRHLGRVGDLGTLLGT